MTTQRKEIGLEQFFTKVETALELSNIITSIVETPSEVIEPSAGDGVWFQTTLTIDSAYDLEPKHPEVVQQNFLELDLPYKAGRMFVGNPPFGRRGSLAMKFINKCAEAGDYIAFILPASFGKESLKNQVSKHFDLVFQKEMLEEDFRTSTGTKKVKTVFQIWKRTETKRKDLQKQNSCKDFSFVSGPEKADLAITTHGVAYGKVYETNFQEVSKTTNRFIVSKIDKSTLAERLRNLDLKPFARFTTGAPCVSQTELVELYSQKHLTIG